MKLTKIPKHKLITVIDICTSMLKSQYGFISYLDWCKREVVRLGGNAQLVVDTGRCAIADLS